jgi:hypothetical protein
VSSLAKNQRLHLLSALFIVATLTAAFLVNSPTTVQATPIASDSIDIQIDHKVQIRNGGLIVINDTVKLSAETDQNITLSSFLLGFPYIYQQNLDYVYAYDGSNTRLNINPNVGLGKTGFYGVEVELNVEDGRHYEFTVVFVFSNLITSSPKEAGQFSFNATFPAYPSLTQNISKVSLTVTLPSNVRFVNSSFAEKGIEFTNTTIGTVQILNYTRNNLYAFTYEPFWLEFEGTSRDFMVIEAKEIKRDITVDSWKHVFISDSYEIIPIAGNLSELKIQLPQGAFEVSAWDEFGNPFKKENIKIEQGNAIAPTNVTLTFVPQHVQNDSAKFKLTYEVPWENIISQKDWQSYRMVLQLFENFWIVRKLVVTLTLPEGAEFTHLPDLGMVEKSVFQETLTFVYHNITPFQDLSQEATYEYTVFWSSFRPTLWVGTAVAVLGVLALLWRAPRPAVPPIPTIPVRREELKSYVDAYEEKRRSQRELETLEERARKRKIPRRRYKVRKRALESRLSVLSKDLARLREKLQSASSKYADMMRQIEVAEAELEGIEAGIRRTETRYRRGEISTAAYHKLLENYYRRRERARTTIDGVLLRLREEIA